MHDHLISAWLLYASYSNLRTSILQGQDYIKQFTIVIPGSFRYILWLHKKIHPDRHSKYQYNINECWAVTTDNTSCLWCDKKMKAISRIKPKNRKKRLNSSFTSTSCTPSVPDCHPTIQPVIPLNSLNSHLLHNVSRLYPGQRAEAVICTKEIFSPCKDWREGGQRLVSPEHYTQVTVSHSTVHSLRPDVSNDFTFTYQAMVTSNKQLFSNALSGCQSAGELSKSADSAKPTNTCQSLVFTIYTIQLIFPPLVLSL